MFAGDRCGSGVVGLDVGLEGGLEVGRRGEDGGRLCWVCLKSSWFKTEWFRRVLVPKVEGARTK